MYMISNFNMQREFNFQNLEIILIEMFSFSIYAKIFLMHNFHLYFVG